MQHINNDQFIKSIIKNYYKKVDLHVSSVSQREFGIGFFDKIEVRHLKFNDIRDLRDFLVEKKPRYVSYSSALYSYPDLRPMEKKMLMSCELTFDIDINTNTVLISHAELSSAKEEVYKLIDDFLVSDFGITKDKILINFSGNRGFHVHVIDDEIMRLDSESRRHITDYITGKLFDKVDIFFEINKNVIKNGITCNDLGLRKRLSDAFVREMHVQHLADFSKLKESLISGKYEGIVLLKNQKQKLQKLYESIRKKVFVNIDEKVSFDLTKLIRMPDSIHGSTGMIAKKISYADLDKFNPYENALVKFKGDVEVVSKSDLEVAEFELNLKQKTRHTLPIKKAFVLACLNLIDVQAILI
ncbi:MAG: DNA primase catalytic subunit PriS [Candidatus Micrarchaeota archaeon]|nr:DNA primase catalytic subunit PriS [Candidatus Micrarchaeota archaeon]